MKNLLSSIIILLLTLFFITACGNTDAPPNKSTATPQNTDNTTDSTPTNTATDTPLPVVDSTDTPDAPTEKKPGDVAKNGKPLLYDPPSRPYENIWNTDFSLHTVPYTEILSGGVPRDGIPPIDNPKFISIEESKSWLTDPEPIFVVTINGQTKGYPLQILTMHEIVNDEIDNIPIVVTFCPLCNSAITFKRTLNGIVYDFGVSGKLRNSDLIMWDRQTESWWQQLTGEAIVGELVGEQLSFIPTQLTSVANFKSSYPEALVLSRETGFDRQYGRNPYNNYDSNPNPFLFKGETDNRLHPVERIIAVDLNDETVAYPYPVLAAQNVIADTVGGQDIVIFWQEGTVSALDRTVIAASKDVGSATVFSPNLDDQKLSFTWNGTAFVDEQTNSEWDIFGNAIKGELAGQSLKPIIHANHFWFAWAAFKPNTKIYALQ